MQVDVDLTEVRLLPWPTMKVCKCSGSESRFWFWFGLWNRLGRNQTQLCASMNWSTTSLLIAPRLLTATSLLSAHARIVLCDGGTTVLVILLRLAPLGGVVLACPLREVAEPLDVRWGLVLGVVTDGCDTLCAVRF